MFLCMKNGNDFNSHRDPDNWIYDEMDKVEKNSGPLDTFLESPDFERYYGGIFDDQYLFLLGNNIKYPNQKEDYEKWLHYCENGFDGTVVCPSLNKNLRFFNHMNQASIFFFCIYQSDSTMELSILEALENKADVIIQLYDRRLYAKYSKKYKQATIVLAEGEKESVLYETDVFMINSYNRWKQKEKVYRR